MDPTERTLIEGEDDISAVCGACHRDEELVVLLECDRPLALSSRHFLSKLESVEAGRAATRSFARHSAPQRTATLGVPDRWMSTRHARFTRQAGSWWVTDTGSTNGTRVNGQRIDERKLGDGDLIELGHTLALYRADVEVPSGVPADVEVVESTSDEPAILTLLPGLQQCLDELLAVARADLSILIGGPSGSGKEVLARQVARGAPRPGEFVAVNCGAIPENLLESELFGSTKGSFSGADSDRIGLVRTAHRGWLFLDEIGDLPLGAQAALLRVLQEREVRPVGAARTIPVDLKLISATHQDLEAMVRAGKFRGDLLARIAGHRVQLPPLRDRTEDLGVLIGTLLGRLEGDQAKRRKLAPDAVVALCRYPWPFNVRELRNCLAAACSLAQDGPVRIEHLPAALRSGGQDEPSVDPPQAPAQLSLDQQQHRDELVALLEEHQGNVSALARATGKARSQYQRWFRRYGLDPERFRR